jgi:sterol desaturase/sphingolipid hydroxylase (fatty acid hydroxylase superfamily)
MQVIVDGATESFGSVQQALFEAVVQPILFAFGGGALLEDAYNATGVMLLGLVQVTLMTLVIGPLQRLRPIEVVRDRRAVRTDILYTLIHRLGLFRLAAFFLVEPLVFALAGGWSLSGFEGLHLDALIAPIWRGVTDTALAALVVYLLVFDFIEYWLHRLSHRYDWWWALHAVHHSQRQMTMWSDSRNHLLDDLIRDIVWAVIGRLIGVPPGQFVAVFAVGQLIENLSHANVRMYFGWLGERLLVSPRFHRVHHAVGLGHETRGRGTLGGHNFAVLFPVWDILFRTASFAPVREPTGIRDQLEHGRDYGRGFWQQQRLGLLRMIGRG